MKTWTRSEIEDLLATNDKAVVRGLIRLFTDGQTADEQSAATTFYHNRRGFNGHDAEFLSSLAKQAIAGRQLSSKQMTCARKAIRKYAGQLTNFANAKVV